MISNKVGPRVSREDFERLGQLRVDVKVGPLREVPKHSPRKDRATNNQKAQKKNDMHEPGT